MSPQHRALFYVRVRLLIAVTCDPWLFLIRPLLSALWAVAISARPLISIIPCVRRCVFSHKSCFQFVTKTALCDLVTQFYCLSLHAVYNLRKNSFVIVSTNVLDNKLNPFKFYVPKFVSSCAQAAAHVQ